MTTTDPRPDLTKDAVLAPCPFCGGRAEIVNIDDGENAGGSCVSCTRCLASSNVEFEFKENFVSNWNRRTAAPLLDVTGEEGLREQIAAVLSDALLNEYGARMDLVDELAGRIAPLITASIAQARAEGAAQWQPIETAPRDGTAVLVQAKGCVCVARVKPAWNSWSSVPGDYSCHPTCWMPLRALKETTND